jgi:hypothetical protein
VTASLPPAGLLVAQLGASVSLFCAAGDKPSNALRVHRMKVAACAFMASDLAQELARNVVAVLVCDESEDPFVICVDALRLRMTTDRVGIRRIPAMRDGDVVRCARAMADAWGSAS